MSLDIHLPPSFRRAVRERVTLISHPSHSEESSAKLGRPYPHRAAAGSLLAAKLPAQLLAARPLVLAVSCGGVPVAAALAEAIDAPLEIFIVRKLRAPQQPELPIGAIASGGYEVRNEPAVAELGLSDLEIAEIADRETGQLRRQESLFRQGRTSPALRGRTLILVDEGITTGCTMRVAITAARDQGAATITVAVPVGPANTCAQLASIADRVICPLQPDPLYLVALWYDELPPVTDEEVQTCLAGHRAAA